LSPTPDEDGSCHVWALQQNTRMQANLYFCASKVISANPAHVTFSDQSIMTGPEIRHFFWNTSPQ